MYGGEINYFMTFFFFIFNSFCFLVYAKFTVLTVASLDCHHLFPVVSSLSFDLTVPLNHILQLLS